MVTEDVKNEGINFERLNRNRTGEIWVSGNGGLQTFQDQVMEFAKGVGTTERPIAIQMISWFLPAITVA